MLGGSQGTALAVSTNGLVMGFAEDGGGTPQPVLWQCGTATPDVHGADQRQPDRGERQRRGRGHGVASPSLDHVGWHWYGGKPRGCGPRPARWRCRPRSATPVGSWARRPPTTTAREPHLGEAPERAASWASLNAPAEILPACRRRRRPRLRRQQERGRRRQLPGERPLHPRGVGRRGQGDGPAGSGRRLGIARAIDDTGIAVGDAVPASGDPEAVTWDVGHHPKAMGRPTAPHARPPGLVHGRAVGQPRCGEPTVSTGRRPCSGTPRAPARCHRCRGTPGAGVTAAD